MRFKSLSIIDESLAKAGLTEVLSRAGIQLNVGKFIGGVVQLFIILVTLVAAFDIVGLSGINRYLSEQILEYIPNVMVAALILIAGVVIAEFVKNFVKGATKATKLRFCCGCGDRCKVGCVDIFYIDSTAPITSCRENHRGNNRLNGCCDWIGVWLGIWLGRTKSGCGIPRKNS